MCLINPWHWNGTDGLIFKRNKIQFDLFLRKQDWFCFINLYVCRIRILARPFLLWSVLTCNYPKVPLPYKHIHAIGDHFLHLRKGWSLPNPRLPYHRWRRRVLQQVYSYLGGGWCNRKYGRLQIGKILRSRFRLLAVNPFQQTVDDLKNKGSFTY